MLHWSSWCRSTEPAQLPGVGQSNNTQGQQVQLADVAEVRETTGPDVINHVDLERLTTLTVWLLLHRWDS